jgi:8-oxo-dGTP diphosphatase
MSDYDPNYVEVKSYVLVGQKAIVLNGEDKLLLMQRSEKLGKDMPWSLAGGAVDRGEDPENGIRREIREETQLEVKDVRPYILRSYMNNDDFVIIVGYVCSAVSENVVLNWEHEQYKWVTKDEAFTYNLTSDARFFIEKYI